MALEMRFQTTCCSRKASPRTMQESDSILDVNSRLFVLGSDTQGIHCRANDRGHVDRFEFQIKLAAHDSLETSSRSEISLA